MDAITHDSDIAAAVRALAARHAVVYRPTRGDVLGHHITRLAGDDVVLDETELLLLALERAGHLGGIEAVRLHALYRRQAGP